LEKDFRKKKTKKFFRKKNRKKEKRGVKACSIPYGKNCGSIGL
jgi:hypothetical protein